MDYRSLRSHATAHLLPKDPSVDPPPTPQRPTDALLNLLLDPLLDLPLVAPTPPRAQGGKTRITMGGGSGSGAGAKIRPAPHDDVGCRAPGRYKFSDDSPRDDTAKQRRPQPRRRRRKRTDARRRTGFDSASGTDVDYSSSEDHCHRPPATTIDGNSSSSSRPLPPPPGLANVGNTCYANAALQCLLSTALPHALLDPKNAPIIRRYSFNRKLLRNGSGSVSSQDDSGDSDSGTLLSGCGSYLSNRCVDDDDEVLLARIQDDDYSLTAPHSLSGVRTRSKESRRRRKRISDKKSRRDRDDCNNSSMSCASTYMSAPSTAPVPLERQDRPSEADLLCQWLTQELMQVTREYTSPPTELRLGKSASNPQSNSLFGVFGGTSSSKGGGAVGNRVVDPGSITRHVHKISPTLCPYQQEDAHEFLRSLLSSLTMHGQNSKLSSLFDGLLESAVTCRTCRKTSLTRDRYMDLSLDIADRNVTDLEGALRKFTEEETLDADNMVNCERCKTKRVVTKGLRLATAPTMLVINFKRFAYDPYGRLVRLSKPVRFPTRLYLRDYMSKANRGNPAPYSLVAVLVHRGRSCDCGHYFAYVRRGPDWYLCNDAVVNKVDEEVVLSAQAYVLVYEVEGMKERHGFDCYSRYHKTSDGDDQQPEPKKDVSPREGITSSNSWDFSSLAKILDACALCGTSGDVDDATTVQSAPSTETPSQKKRDRRDLPPQPKSRPQQKTRANKAKEKSGTAESSASRPRRDSGEQRVEDPQRETTAAHPDRSSSDDDPGPTEQNAVRAYYRRGRSHTPSRDPREDKRQDDEDSERDFLRNRPGGDRRRAKSLSRMSILQRREERKEQGNPKRKQRARKRTRSRDGGSRRRRSVENYRARDRGSPADDSVRDSPADNNKDSRLPPLYDRRNSPER